MNWSDVPEDIIINLCEYLDFNPKNVSDRNIKSYLSKIICPTCFNKVKISKYYRGFILDCCGWILELGNNLSILESYSYYIEYDGTSISQQYEYNKFSTKVSIYKFGMLKENLNLNRRFLHPNFKRDDVINKINKLLIFA